MKDIWEKYKKMEIIGVGRFGSVYRGKNKGRNCYIIYIESKHADIVVKDVVNPLIERLKYVRRVLEVFDTVDAKLKHLVDFMYTDLHCSAAYIMLPDSTYVSNLHEGYKTTGIPYNPHFELLLNGDTIFYDSPLHKYKENDVVFGKYVDENKIKSLIISKVKVGKYQYGYIIITETSMSRVWQEAEVAVVLYATSLLELVLKDYK